MTEFVKSHTPPGEFEKVRRAYHEKPASWFAKYFGHEPTPQEKHELIEHAIKSLKNDNVWLNDLYQVAVRNAEVEGDFPAMWHLSIKRRDREPIHDWRELMEIKDRLIGPEHEGVELYPAHSRVVDTANQYHLFVLKDPEIRFPFGFASGRVVDDDAIAGSKQRPLK